MLVYIISILVVVIASAYIFHRFRLQKSHEDPNDATWLVRAYEEKQRALQNAQPFSERVKELLSSNPKWDQIFGVLNPSGDVHINELLLQFRGPHLFSPNVAINILEKCVQRMESQSIPIDSKVLLQMALDEANQVLDWHK